MPWREPPVVDFEHEPQYQWPFWHVDCQENDLFGDLHQRFNTMPYPAYIQDPESFYKDVVEITLQADSRDDFFDRMQKRRDKRFTELDGFRRRLFALHEHGFTCLSPEQSFCLFRMDFCPSLDSVVAFYASLLAPDQSGKEPSLDFFPPPRQWAALGEKERRLRSCHRPSQQSSATVNTEDLISTSQSTMLTPPAGPAPSPTETRQPAQSSYSDTNDREPVLYSKKRKASCGVNGDQGNCVTKFQRTDAGKQPLTPPESDTSAVHLEAISSSLVDATASSQDTHKLVAATRKKQSGGARASAARTKATVSRLVSTKHNAARHGSQPDACSPPRRSRRIAARRDRLQGD